MLFCNVDLNMPNWFGICTMVVVWKELQFFFLFLIIQHLRIHQKDCITDYIQWMLQCLIYRRIDVVELWMKWFKTSIWSWFSLVGVVINWVIFKMRNIFYYSWQLCCRCSPVNLGTVQYLSDCWAGACFILLQNIYLSSNWIDRINLKGYCLPAA